MRASEAEYLRKWLMERQDQIVNAHGNVHPYFSELVLKVLDDNERLKEKCGES